MRSRSLLLTMTACAAAACTGSIVGPRAEQTPGGGAAEAAGCEPATFALGRLNRRELDATFAQQWGDTSAPARLFVADSVAPGSFDNSVSQLAIAPQLVVDLEAAATRIVNEAWARDTALLNAGSPAPGGTMVVKGSACQATVGGARGDDWNLWSNGEAKFAFNLAGAGAFRVVLDVYGEQAGSEVVRVETWLNGVSTRTDDVPGTASAHTRIEFDATLPAGNVTVGLRFPNDTFDAATGLDRNLLISSVSLTPMGAPTPGTPGAVAKVQVCRPTSGAESDCARDIIAHFARKAWRRAATGDELAELLALYSATRDDGDDFATATRLALRAVLASPNFLMRTEAVMDELGPRAPAAVAARLSFFLWGGPPDDTLDALADDGTLLDDAVLGAQVDRLMADQRASALRTQLVGQWLDTRDMAGFSLDPGLFPGVNQSVMNGVQLQIDAYVDEYFFRDQDALDALDAPVTWVDGPLAGFLGLGTAQGLERRALPAGHARAGLLGQSAPLIVTSKSTETDPPRRGKWVMERLLCQPIPLPTGIDIPPVPLAGPTQPTARDRLEALTSPAACAGCHAMLNPIGFGLENYGADSRFRTEDHGAPIITSGTFRGTAFQTPGDLATLLKHDPAVQQCMVKKALSYAVGRSLGSEDDATVAALNRAFAAEGRRFKALVRDVALSPLVVNGCQLK